MKAQFEEANRIVKKARHPKGKFESGSARIGSWFIMSYPELVRDPIIEDGNNYLSQVYLVDMLGKRVISRNDWQSVLPLYQLMISRLPAEPLDREYHLSIMASLTSIIAFGHTHYNDLVFHADPHNPHVASLWYVIGHPELLLDAVIHCVLKITEDSITFEIFERDSNDTNFNPFHDE